MKRGLRPIQQVVWSLISAVLLVMISTSISAQETSKKFLKKPLVIEDQGSFFIGGVPKVTNFATLPPANNPAVGPTLLATAGLLAASVASAQTPPPGNVNPGSTKSGASV